MSSVFQEAIAHAANNDAGFFIASLGAISSRDAGRLIESLNQSAQKVIIPRLPAWLFHQLIDRLKPELLRAVLNELTQAEIYRLCASLGSEDFDRVGVLLEPQQLNKVKGIKRHSHSPLLKIMDDEAVVCEPASTIGLAQERLSYKKPAQSSTIFIADSNGQYVGAVSMLHVLLHTDKEGLLTSIMFEKQPSLYVGMSENQIKKIYASSNLENLPLCLESGVFLGAISNKRLSNYVLGLSRKNKSETPAIDTFFEAAGAGIGGLFDILSGQPGNRSQL